MDLATIKKRLREIEPDLPGAPWVLFAAFEREGRVLHVGLTDRLRKHARKAGVWSSKEIFTTLKNAAYGFDEQRARSGGGVDGIFLLDRSYRPVNAMMRKIFDGFLDKPGGDAEIIAGSVGTTVEKLLPVRLVSHHLRLLGVLWRDTSADWLILVDCDRGE